MKLGCMTVAWRSEQTIGAAIASVIDHVDEHVVAVGAKPWHWDDSPIPPSDATLEIALSFSGVRTITDGWSCENDQRNAALEVLREAGCGPVLLVDADELYEPEDVAALVRILRDGPPRMWHVPQILYWKSPSWRIDADRPLHAIFGVHTDMRFSRFRTVDGASTEYLRHDKGLRLHHLGFVRTDEGMREKTLSFEHAPGADGGRSVDPEWYGRVWLPWTPDTMGDVSPYRNARWTAVPADLPVSLRRLLHHFGRNIPGIHES